MDFVAFPGGAIELGWRFSLPSQVLQQREASSGIAACIARSSPARQVRLSAFEIARQAVPLSDLIGDPYDLDDDLTLASLCELVDARLASDGLRLASEDELEVAAGGELFPWGMHIPDGIPYGDETSFVGHLLPNALGIQLLGNPYKVELCRTALKFGDGGESICGEDPWPLAWLVLSPSFRLTDDDIADCFPETLEECYVRPVRRA